MQTDMFGVGVKQENWKRYRILPIKTKCGLTDKTKCGCQGNVKWRGRTVGNRAGNNE